MVWYAVPRMHNVRWRHFTRHAAQSVLSRILLVTAIHTTHTKPRDEIIVVMIRGAHLTVTRPRCLLALLLARDLGVGIKMRVKICWMAHLVPSGQYMPPLSSTSSNLEPKHSAKACVLLRDVSFGASPTRRFQFRCWKEKARACHFFFLRLDLAS